MYDETGTINGCTPAVKLKSFLKRQPLTFCEHRSFYAFNKLILGNVSATDTGFTMILRMSVGNSPAVPPQNQAVPPLKLPRL